MDKPSHTLSGRNHLTAMPPSPRLIRSRSGNGSTTATITTPERSSHRFCSSERFTTASVQRSKSTSRTRTTNNNEGNDINLKPILTTSISKKQTNIRVQEKKNRNESSNKFLQRGVSPDNNNVGASKRTSSLTKSPSAWALSPGRWSLGSSIWPQPVTKSHVSSNSSVGGSVNKVLKYFKQKKVSPIQEEEYHRFRVLHNRLLQWMFINARAQVAMANVKKMAEVCSFCL